MKNIMNTKKIMIFGIIVAIGIGLLTVFVVFNGSGSGGSGSDDSSFPFFIFFPSWVAIFVPIIAQKRQEAKKREEEYRNQLEE